MKSGPPSRSGSPPLSGAELIARDRRRRRKELLFAALAFLLVLLLTWVQLEQFRSGDSLFVVMFNINFVLLIGILLVVLRNGFKLLLERRRGILGSGLRARLVAAFVAFSLLPCLLMCLITTKYVQLSMDFWFKERVESSMATALELVGNIYERTGQSLVRRVGNIKTALEEARTEPDSESGEELLRGKAREYGDILIDVFNPAGYAGRTPAGGAALEAANLANSKLDREKIRRQGYDVTLISTEAQDYIFAAVALDKEAERLLLAGSELGPGFSSGTELVMRGSREYSHLRNIKNPLKLMLYSSLGVLTALIILGAVWFGFRLARELTAPISALAQGTDRIAAGDLSVRLTENPQNEFGMLIRSFNRMASDLEESRRETTDAYTLLEQQNLETARHSKYMETVLDNIAAGVLSFDDQGRISTVNTAAGDILNMDPKKMIGKKIGEFMPETYGAIAETIKERLRRRIESRSRHSVGLSIAGEEKRLLLNAVGFSTEGVYRGAVAVFEDITELERMQRMAAWREVARRIAHEIKNPLTPIKLSAQRLAKKFGAEVNDPAFIQGTELIVRQVEHLQAMVQEFSAFAKLPEVAPRPDDILGLLQTVLELFRSSHADIGWKLSAPEAPPLLPIDREAMNRAFMNILGNAAEALNQGTVSPLVHVTVSCLPALNLVRIDVADNGPGLTEEERSRIFEPYFSRKKGGTGLGLTIVRSIVTDHRGYVRALHNEGGGTMISMELPLG
ncbi:MAG: HAMP domain-containing protein [Desulfovibrio sp.]|jgi:two-component system nitrogen regulation sensor histidine kinase NtrY|nr:HAMP domain-containing protein [Desulfovibrio sp.]